jgi:hypothetical protein
LYRARMRARGWEWVQVGVPHRNQFRGPEDAAPASSVRLDRRDAVAGARRYRFLAILALAQTVAGCLIIFAAVLTAFAVLSPWPGAIVTRVPVEWRERLAPAAIGGIAVAIILGGSLAITGQMLLLLRDIHRHAARLDARDRRHRREPGRPPGPHDAASRLLPRR